MKLLDIINQLKEINPDLIIFLEEENNIDSNIILLDSEESDTIERIYNGKTYYYLIEIFLANEFIDDWRSSLKYKPSAEETVRRLYEFAINDA